MKNQWLLSICVVLEVVAGFSCDDAKDGEAGDTVADIGVHDSSPLQDAQPNVDAAIDCPYSLGSGSLTGTIKGQNLVANAAGAAEIEFWGMTGYSIGFGTQGGTCEQAPDLVQSASVGIYLCEAKTGTYEVNSDCLSGGSGLSLKNTVQASIAGQTVKATGGRILIEAFDPACGGSVRGHFSADFSGETLTGQFDTVSCGFVKF